MGKYDGTWNNRIEYAAASDVGLRRANNQDSFGILLAANEQQFVEQGHLFVVADGMGAHAAGELASKIATDIIPLSYYKLHDPSRETALWRAVREAHQQIHEKGQGDEAFRGMGTTVDAMVVLPHGVLIGHVGDSRAYRLRGQALEQLTFDHSLVWELRAAGEFPDGQVPSYVPRNVITRSLGPNAEVEIDIEGTSTIEPGDTFLLCSDGLSGQVSDEELGQILMTLPPRQAVSALVNLANLRGGPDNITVIVVRVLKPLETSGGQSSKGLATQSNAEAATVIWWLAAVCLVIGILFGAMSNIPGALIVGACAVLFAATALALRFAKEPHAAGVEGRPGIGKGPYTQADARPHPSFAAALGKIVRELREAAEADQWSIDWTRFNRHDQKAADAIEKKDFAEAIREYSCAIGRMMEELKRQNS